MTPLTFNLADLTFAIQILSLLDVFWVLMAVLFVLRVEKLEQDVRDLRSHGGSLRQP